MTVHFDEQFWPVVLMRLEGELAPADISAMAAGYARAFRREAKFAAVVDLRQLGSVPSARVRKMITDWMREIEVPMEAHCAGGCTVIRSALLRGALTALFWVFTPPIPQNYVGDLSDVVPWCRARLSEHGVHLGEAGERLEAHLRELEERGRPSAPGGRPL